LQEKQIFFEENDMSFENERRISILNTVKRKTDINIIEVIGGRLDLYQVITPLISVINKILIRSYTILGTTLML
jgi:folylpolyglutamate synthase/dihydropteroate synthase